MKSGRKSPVRRKAILFITLVAALVLLSCPAYAVDQAAIKALKAKVEDAAKFLSEKGKDGLAEFAGQENKWKQEPYIFVYDMTGTIIGHTENPKLIGKNLMGLKDVKGNMFAAEFVGIAKEKGKGWSEYWWPKPGQKEASLKVSYILKVPNQDMLVGAGIYDVGKKEATAAAGE